MILDFQEEVFFTKYPAHSQRFALCTFVIPVEKSSLDLPRKTSRKGDYPFTVLRKDFLIDPRLIVKAVAIAFRNDLHQILISLIVFGKKDEVSHKFVFFNILIEACAGSSVDFTAYHRFYPLFLTFSIKIYYTEHNAVIGYGN